MRIEQCKFASLYPITQKTLRIPSQPRKLPDLTFYLVLTSELFQICDCEQNSDHPGHDLLTRAELEECDELTDLLSDLSLDREYYRWFMDIFFNQVSLASDWPANEIY